MEIKNQGSSLSLSEEVRDGAKPKTNKLLLKHGEVVTMGKWKDNVSSKLFLLQLMIFIFWASQFSCPWEER